MPEPLRPADPAQAERLHTFAHDIKNRIGGLWEVLRMLRSGAEGIDQEELISFAERGFFGAQRDVESLLDDLRVERGITLRDTAPFNPMICLQEAVTKEKYRLEKKDQHLRINGSINAQVIGDPHWITLLLQALISNASKFSGRGSMIVADISSSKNEVAMRVIDQGIGLSPEDMPHLFTRYTMLTSRSTEGEAQSRGTLARAKQWAEAHGGSLSATSEGAGKGSVFEVRLPIADQE